MKKRLEVSLVKLGEFDKKLYKLKLDSKRRDPKGLLIWPSNLPKGFHLHFYQDSKDSRFKAHIKDEKASIRIPYTFSFRRFNKQIIKSQIHNTK